MENIPAIKLFIDSDKYYCYDAYTNAVMSISRQHYIELSNLLIIGVDQYLNKTNESDAYRDIVLLIKKGYFKADFIESVCHPDAKYLTDIVERGMYDMTLQVTKDCNFKCRYCSFARDHRMNRSHDKVSMPWEIAKKSIDYLFNHSKDSEEVYLSFYGGEPLLNFDLIKKAVEYAKDIFNTKIVHYNMTTNGSVMSKEIAEFMILHKFHLLISLDGPREYQDKHRRYYINGASTYDAVMRNIELLSQNRDYFKKYVQFSSVLMHDEEYNKVLSFFESLGIDKTSVEYTYANLDGVDYTESPIRVSSNARLRQNEVDIENDTVTYNFYRRMALKLSDKKRICDNWHHSGPCIPSVTRVFVNTDGELYPCEKIIESPITKIGSILNGFDYSSIDNQMNVGKLTEDKCRHCWAMRFCEICAMKCIDYDQKRFSAELKEKVCEYQKLNIEKYLKRAINCESGVK